MSEAPRRLQIAGPAGALSVLAGGVGARAVVLVHGLAGTSSWWDATLAHLASRHRVIAYDLRGHGESAAPADEAYGLEAHTEDLLAVLDQLRIERAVLVGHSFGATVVVHALASLAAARVAGVVLVEAAGDFSRAPVGAIEQFIDALHSEMYAEMVADAFTENLGRATDATKSLVLAGVERTAPAAMQGCYTALLRWNPGAALQAWQGPLLLVGDAGNESDYALHAQHRHRPVHLVRDASHWLHLDQPAVFRAALDDFLGALGASDV